MKDKLEIRRLRYQNDESRCTLPMFYSQSASGQAGQAGLRSDEIRIFNQNRNPNDEISKPKPLHDPGAYIIGVCAPVPG